MTGSTLNLLIYKVLRASATKVRRLWPGSWLMPKRDLSPSFTIGITTYEERYEKYFKPLYRDLLKIFPDVQIVVGVNGIQDQDKQQAYLHKIIVELSSCAPKSHTFILHDNPVGLTCIWNEIIDQCQTQTLLLLNDDLSIYPWIRYWAEKFNWSTRHLVLINNSWSHFVLPLSVYRMVGPFDERFTGIGFEDMDYTARMGILKLPIINVICSYIDHHEDQPIVTSYDNSSSRVWGKYTSVNQEYFFEKWRVSSDSTGSYIRQLNSYVKSKMPLQELTTSRKPNIKYNKQDRCIYPDRILTNTAQEE